MSVIVDNARLGFFAGFKPYRSEDFGGDPKYMAALIVSPDNTAIKALTAIIREAAVGKWKDKAELYLQQAKAAGKLPIKKGDLRDRAEYKGMLYLNTSRRVDDGPPSIQATVNGVNVEVAAQHPKAPYSGCWVRASVEAYAWEHKAGGKGVSLSLRGLLFLRHDKRLSGAGTASMDEMGIAASEADGDEPEASSDTSEDLV